jgi:hypothetical protein
MDERLKKAYAKVINKHFSAVQADTELGLTDSWKLEKIAKKFWADYQEAEKEFKALLERCRMD